MAGNKPIRKVTATGAGGLLTTLAVALADVAGAGLPEWLAAALVLVAGTGAGYVVPSAPGEPTAPGRGVPMLRVE